MGHHAHHRPGITRGLGGGAGVLAGAAALALSGIAAPGVAAPAVAAPAHAVKAAPHAGLAVAQRVSATPAPGTPHLDPTGTTEQVRQLVRCRGTMYAVGSFTSIGQGSATFTRDNIFSFSATSPFKVTSWNPGTNGIVNSIALNGNCTEAYIGGNFTEAGGTTVKDLAEISTSTGAVNPAFGSHAGGVVETLLLTRGHLLAGGHFTTVNGSHGDAYMTSLNPATGKDDHFVQLNISGHYVYHRVHANTTEVFNQQLSHSGKLELVEGDFTSVGGKARQQIFMLNLGGSQATVTGWSSPEFDGSKGNLPGGYAYQCGDSHPEYIKAAAWSVDDSKVFIADTGFVPWNWNGKFPLTSLCDAAAAFPATQKEVLHTWLNEDGCDSLHSAAADASTVYVAGHNRWFDDPMACNRGGKGSIPDQGLAGLTPGGGKLVTNSAGTAGRYSRGRGQGADDMLVTGAGLWIASDNFAGTDKCGRLHGFAGICFLPYN
jgi:hypothetical protein